MFHPSEEFANNLKSGTNDEAGIYDPFVLPVQPLTLPSHASTCQSLFPFLNNTSHNFPFPSPAMPTAPEMHWQANRNKSATQEDVATPTNAHNSLFDFNTATPEFIHPRSSNTTQWLMSPPIECQEQYTTAHPVADESPLSVNEHLCTPEDFVLHDQINESRNITSKVLNSLCTPSDFVLPSLTESPIDECSSKENKNVLNGFVTSSHCLSESFATLDQTNRSDSGVNSPENIQSSVLQSGENQFFKKLFVLSRSCKSFEDFQQEMSELFPNHICDTVLSLLFSFSLSQNTIHNYYQSLLSKVSTESGASGSTTKDGQATKCPIAVFWDIENCQVPSGKSALAIVQKIRKTFFKADHTEEEFMVVCDINKESNHVTQDLNNAQVNVVHVNATAKNAADDKLRQSIRRFAHSHKAPATVILITGDCNFTSEVSDLRHRHKFFVVLIHQVNASSMLVQSASSAVSYEKFVEDLPNAYPVKKTSSEVQLLVSNLPVCEDSSLIRARLKTLSTNCGGKVVRLTPPTAVIKFGTNELAARALKRMHGEDVCGMKIEVQKTNSDLSVFSKHFTPRHRRHVQVQQRNLHRQALREESSSDGSKSETTVVPVKDDSAGIQLTISNIDAQLGTKAIQETILNLVSKSSVVWQLQIRPHNRFTVMCDVTVPNVNAALRVLLQLHRRKIGSKRVLVTISQQPPDLAHLRNSNKLDVCQQHYRHNTFPNKDVKISMPLREFSAKLHALLHSHGGVVHMNGFEYCYEAEFGSFPYPQKGKGGVYLEHEVSYVPGVRIVDGRSKTIMWSQPHSDVGSDTASETSSGSRSKPSALAVFTKELIDLLKTCRYCCMPLGDFVAKYQLHFGRPFKLAEPEKLTEVLAAIPHVAQIMGSPDHRLVTLTHRAQVKRFTQEIIKVLKTSPDRAMLVTQLPGMYLKTMNRPWKVCDYGVSVLSDLLDDIPDGNICVSGEGDNIVLSLPARERSVDEIMRTSQFARELVEILRPLARCRMRFTDFVPAYHRHFGRQCKLAKYGFTKLLDLFEAIPHVVKVIDETSEKFLQLTDDERLKVLTSQIIGIVRKPSCESEADQNMGVPLDRLQSLYLRKYGFPLVPKDYNCTTVEAVVKMLLHVVKVVKGVDGRPLVRETERKPIRLLATQLLVLLLDIRADSVEWEQLHDAYRDRYSEGIVPGEYGYLSLHDLVVKALSGIAKFECSGGVHSVHVKPIYQRAKRVRNILLKRGGPLSLGDFNQAYRAQYNEQLDAERHGFRSCEAMLRALSLVLVVKGFGIKKMLVLRNHMQYGPLSSSLPAFDNYERTDDEAKVKPLQEIISSNISRDATSGRSRLIDAFAPDQDDVTPCSYFPSGDGLKNFLQYSGQMSQQFYKAADSQPLVQRYGPAHPQSVLNRDISCSIIGQSATSSVEHRRTSSIITLPHGATSISSSSSPESFVSPDDDERLQMMDYCRPNSHCMPSSGGVWSVPLSTT